jgi:hypothetical protein
LCLDDLALQSAGQWAVQLEPRFRQRYMQGMVSLGPVFAGLSEEYVFVRSPV